jgi:hypothetical protein
MILSGLLEAGDRWRAMLAPELGRTELERLLRAPVAHRSKYAQVLNDGAGHRRAVKLIRPRSLPRDLFRKYVQCQAKREYDAARYLNKWGVPAIGAHGWALALKPSSPFESLLIMEYRANCVHARSYLETHAEPQTQWALLTHIADDIAAIYARGWHHNDCHLGNVLVDEQGRHTWVDNELRPVRNQKRLARRFDETLLLLEQSFKTSVDDEMKRAFRDYCRKTLARRLTGGHHAGA